MDLGLHAHVERREAADWTIGAFARLYKTRTTSACSSQAQQIPATCDYMNVRGAPT